MKKIFKFINKFLFVVFLLALVITFFSRNNYRQVDNIHENVILEPIQIETSDKELIRFIDNDYDYELEPLFNYQVDGLIVHKTDYRIFSINKRTSVFPMDLCVIWGENVSSRVFQNKQLKFSQDFRFCMWHWQGDVKVNSDEIANVHLIVNDDNLLKKVESLFRGDQIRVKGKLVNVKAKSIGKPGKYDFDEFSMNSSVSRNDTGAGACEILYVEDIEILKKSNPISYLLFQFSLYGLLILIVINVFVFFKEFYLIRNNKKQN